MALGIAAAGRSGPLGGPRALQPTELSRVTLRAELQATDHYWMPTHVKWQNAVGVSVNGNSITKTTAGSAWDSGASSVQTFWSGDGYVEVTATDPALGRKQFGLSNGDTNQNQSDIDFGLLQKIDGTLHVVEAGTDLGPCGTYVAGDLLRVSVEGGVVVYRQNGTLLHQSVVVPTYPLLVDTSIFTEGATISRAVIAAPPIYPVRWAEAGGVLVQGNKLTKTAATGWGNAGAVSCSVQRLLSGDGFVEVIPVETDTLRAFGLSNDNPDASWPEIDFSFHMETESVLKIIENGLIRADGGGYSPGDRLHISVEAGVVKYRKNGVLLYTSLVAPTYPLFVDTALATLGATLRARVSGMRIHTMHEIDADLGGWGGSPLTPDLLIDGPSIDYGISGTGPLDLVAGTGRLSFVLNNSEENAEGTLGYYSPQHADLCDGFGIGIDVWYRYFATPESEPILKFMGRLKSIDPEPGKYGPRRVSCSASDWMDEAASTKLNIPIQTGKRVDEIMALVVAAIPRQPLGTSFAAGDSTFPYMVGDGDASALTLIQRLYQSEYARCYLRRGILTGEKRTTRLAPLSTVTFDGTMQDLNAPSSSAKIKNKAKVTIHPRRVDAAATTVLFAKPAQSSPSIEPLSAQVLTITGRYTDPAQLAAKVGGMDMVAPTATTDYLLNAQEDGGGADLTADCVVVAVYGANQVDYTISNSGATLGYLIKLQARGRGVYDYDPIDAVEIDQASIDLIGENTVTLDMPYQSDLGIAQPVASFLVSTWVVGGASEASIEFIPRDEDELEIAMGIEPGDALTVREELTGINNVFFVQHVSIDIDGPASSKVSFKWSLQRALIANYWQVGVAGYSEVGITTIVGPF